MNWALIVVSVAVYLLAGAAGLYVGHAVGKQQGYLQGRQDERDGAPSILLMRIPRRKDPKS